ncbi:MAG: translation initiation factor IF-1 [Candidatus Dormibacteria bacterium]
MLARAMPEGKAVVLGTIVEPLPNALFRVSLENGHKILAHGSGGVRSHHLRLLAGDRVKIEVVPENPGRGRIIERLK